jgi:predicted dehydrogenase
MSYQRDFERRLRLGVIGAGGHCYRNLLPLLTYLPVELRAVCDADIGKARSTAAQYGAAGVYADHAEMLARERLDAVLIAVSPQLHPQLTRAALEAGAHVWIEKPPAMRAAEVEEMIAAQRASGRIVVVGFKKAFMPAARKAQELLAGLGRLRSVLGEYAIDIPHDGPAALATGRFTDWLANGVHPLAFLLAVGGEAAAVTVHRGGDGGGACIIEHANGAVGILHLAHGAPRSQVFERYRCCAEQGAVTIEDCRRVTLQRGVPFAYGRTTSFAPPGVDHGALVWEPQNSLSTLENNAWFTQGLYDELMHFCACALDGRAPEHGTLDEALHLMRVYEAALLSGGARIEIARETAAPALTTASTGALA